MSRDDGFPTADLAADFLDDPKFRALWRLLKDQATMAQAVTLYVATVVRSWGMGRRVPTEDAMPLWFTDAEPGLTGLVDSGLLTPEHLVPEPTWERWFRPAWERREARRASGAKGGARSWSEGGGRRVSGAEATLKQAVSGADDPRSNGGVSKPSASLQQTVSTPSPVRPSVPSDPSLFSDAEPNGSATLTGRKDQPLAPGEPVVVKHYWPGHPRAHRDCFPCGTGTTPDDSSPPRSKQTHAPDSTEANP